MVLYRKFRPQKLSDLTGQEIIAKTLLSQLENGNVGHGYLFYGPKGTGKTSTARILAKAVNCTANRLTTNAKRKKEGSVRRSTLNVRHFSEPCNKCLSCLSIMDGSNLDLIEIDAASNRNIDDIRDLREKIKLSPVLGRFKIYIIDEVHMLTKEASNALLKTLEEPPAHAIFILCTTEVSKIPATIISRVQKFNFKRATISDLTKVIEKIAKVESIKIESGLARLIAEASDGSYRDAISLFDQLSSNKKEVEEADVKSIVKSGGWEELARFVENLAQKKLKDIILQIEEVASLGADVSFFAKQLVIFLEKILFIKIGIKDELFSDYASEQIEKLVFLSKQFDLDELQSLMRLILIAEGEIKLYPLPQIPLVLAVCKYCGEPQDNSRQAKVTDPSIKSDNHQVLSEQIDIAIENKVSGFGSNIGKTKSSNGQKVIEIKSLSDIEKHWTEFLARVKNVNAHVVALLRSTRPTHFDGDNLTLEVFYRFHKDKLAEPRIIKMLDATFSEIVGSQVKLKFVLAQKGTKPTQSVRASDVIEINDEDIEKIAMEVFSK